jgi:hypothetical protein
VKFIQNRSAVFEKIATLYSGAQTQSGQTLKEIRPNVEAAARRTLADTQTEGHAQFRHNPETVFFTNAVVSCVTSNTVVNRSDVGTYIPLRITDFQNFASVCIQRRPILSAVPALKLKDR